VFLLASAEDAEGAERGEGEVKTGDFFSHLEERWPLGELL
jgi:hypothetical protein